MAVSSRYSKESSIGSSKLALANVTVNGCFSHVRNPEVNPYQNNSIQHQHVDNMKDLLLTKTSSVTIDRNITFWHSWPTWRQQHVNWSKAV